MYCWIVPATYCSRNLQIAYVRGGTSFSPLNKCESICHVTFLWWISFRKSSLIWFESKPRLWLCVGFMHNEVMKWKHFPCYWAFVRGIHRSPVISPHKGQWRSHFLTRPAVDIDVNKVDIERFRYHCSCVRFTIGESLYVLHNQLWRHHQRCTIYSDVITRTQVRHDIVFNASVVLFCF